MLLTGDLVRGRRGWPTSRCSPTSATTPTSPPPAPTWRAWKVAKMPADGLVIAKEAFRLVEQMQGYAGEEVTS